MHLLYLSRVSAEAITESGYQLWTACGYCRLQRTFAQKGFLPLQYSQWGRNRQEAFHGDVLQTNIQWPMGMTGQSTCLQSAFIRSSSICLHRAHWQNYEKISLMPFFLSWKYTRTVGVSQTAALEQAHCEEGRGTASSNLEHVLDQAVLMGGTASTAPLPPCSHEISTPRSSLFLFVTEQQTHSFSFSFFILLFTRERNSWCPQ